ncbi:peptidoglycan-binding protein [Paenibacillus sp. sgz500958]|uniref:peptidoglycan-binding domain-containing protein n=1 Tax=Paenibacillus sp. sgz500958 TaxID=3242475 RepID=UPI0036D3FF6B
MKSLTLMLLLLIVASFALSPSASASSVFEPGRISRDLWYLQHRLKTLDFFTQPLDGQHGTQTKTAVFKLQKEYGIPVDGLPGKTTWNALKKYSLNIYELDMGAGGKDNTY